ncbi:uncharacterized protein UV8b_02728 [Ustilaginoidea virens]|uniref:Prokaryotic-type class I peptide chain release factors domain-containing protein n=1 Tax=Ustilaginoidea virens TaxID=1159556 RepID=A0A8E5MGE3_USTVR|nr:uncharacterized protein UV8b_02728 [Ustilaginoidea virens]QUC18487.1 hypothetical protein UV8b_02728 [Ustilaginoidea virens]
MGSPTTPMHRLLLSVRPICRAKVPFTASPVAANRRLTYTSPLAKNLPPRPKPPPESEIEESFIKGSGPGGQKINKTDSAVQLKHVPTGIVVKSQATRSRSQNRKHARELLAQKIDDLTNREQSRSSIVGEMKRKKAASAAKKSRRKYRLLEDEKASMRAEIIHPPLAAQGEPAATTSPANGRLSHDAPPVQHTDAETSSLPDRDKPHQ